ncbi:arginine exporter [Escherichia coli]|uniref:Arginine exporter n=1 Tax=Escherichia coli TaxID=562 RepID=A0A376VCM5_ECOLX|nr:arginine exporter [Escherichia coli]
MQSPWLLALVTWGGVAFLLWYGFGAFKTAMSSNIELASAEVLKQGRWKIIATMLAVTWLNPHVYLDTFVVLGSLGGQLDVEPKRWLRSGQLAPLSCGSLVWLFSQPGWHRACARQITTHYQSGCGMLCGLLPCSWRETVLLMHKPCSVRRYLMEKIKQRR